MRRRMYVLFTVLTLVALVAPSGAVAQVPDHKQAKGQDARAQQQRQNGRDITDDVVDSPVEVHGLHDEQHTGVPGHLPGSKRNVKLLGRAGIADAAEGRVADVAAYGNFAYLTVRDPVNCTGEDAAGVAVFDIRNPNRPRRIGFIDATPGSQPGEGAQVIQMRTKSFRGQVLVFNNELCALGGEGGVSLWDVTNPRRPKPLTAHAGDDVPGGAFSTFNQIHSAFAWQAGRRAFVVLTDNEETTDVDILEITNPRKPVLLSELDLNQFDVLQEEGTPLGESSFLHDMVVEKIRGTWTMLLSYWDGGWVLLDVDDPANPVFIDDSDYPVTDALTGLTPSEGNAHQAEFSPDGRFIIGTDEDFSPYRIDPFEITTGPDAGEFPAGEFGFTLPIATTYPEGRVNGPTLYGGLGCPSNDEYGEQPPVPDASSLEAGEGEEKVVVLLRGLCFFSEKVEQAQLAGYDAVIIANHHLGADFGAAPDATPCGSQGHEFTPTIGAICIGHRAFHLLFGQEPTFEPPEGGDEPPLGALGEKVNAVAQFDGWGYVRLLDGKTLEEIDAYAIDEALDPDFAFGFGDLSVHEVAIDPNPRKRLAYYSYYSGGLRVTKYGRGGLREVGHYIHPLGNNFWGVEVHRLPKFNGRFGGRKLILASDIDSGLWIFRYTGN